MEVDLREPFMRDQKPGYERLKRCLERLGEKDTMFSYCDNKGMHNMYIAIGLSFSLKLKQARTKISTFRMVLKAIPANPIYSSLPPVCP